MTLPKVRDLRFVTIRRGGTLTDADHRIFAGLRSRADPGLDEKTGEGVCREAVFGPEVIVTLRFCWAALGAPTGSGWLR